MHRMKNPPPEKDFTRSAGTLMVTAAWIVFLVLLAYLFSQLLDRRNNPNQDIQTQYLAGVKQVSLQRNPYGHYVSNGKINGEPVVFLLDTGATDVAIPMTVADRLGLEKGPAVKVRTANGITTAYRTRLQSVSLGEMTLHDLPASILSNTGTEEVLLGMSFLKHFELIQKGRTLTIRQP